MVPPGIMAWQCEFSAAVAAVRRHYMPRAAAVDDMVTSGETEVLGPEDILRRGEAYYHFMRSYASCGAVQRRISLMGRSPNSVRRFQVQPETVFLHTELARLQMRRGDMPAALQSCQKALRLDPNYQPAAYLVLGQIHANLQHKEEAQAAFRKAIELEPLDEEGYMYLGMLAVWPWASRQTPSRSSRSCCGSSPRRSVGSMNLGVCMPKRATMSRLKSLLKRAIAQQPQFERALSVLGTVYEVQKRYGEAVELYNRVLAVNPRNHAIRHRLERSICSKITWLRR